MKRVILTPDALGRRFMRWWSKRNPYMKTLPLYVVRAINNFVRDGMRSAAALAFYTILSIFPLTLLVAVGISRLLGPAVAQEQIVTGLSLFLPGETVNLLQDNLTDALTQGRSFGLVAIVGLLWAATGLFSNITFSLDLIFRVPSNRSLWRQRIIAAFMAIMLIMLVAASFLTAGTLRLAQTVLLNQPNIWLTISSYFLPIGLNMVIFAMLFRYVPARHVYWDAVWPAAILGALGWELARFGFGLYLTNIANYQFVYGGIATVIVLQFWAYLIAAVFMFSAELCARLNEWFQDNAKNRRGRRQQILFEERRRENKLPKAG
jgi:membrane protein